MKTSTPDLVLLMRHVKSSWAEDGLADHDRPLNKRGLRDAPRMARLLRDENLIPRQIISSTAVRAIDTAKIVATELELEDPVTESRLYHADVATWHLVFSTLGGTGPILLVGHNPGLEELLLSLTGLTVRMPTAAIAVLQPPSTGLSAKEGWLLKAVWRPKEL
ncbi:SixA phosphatase family protein [Planctomicrobium piriforme]|uniref:Phosphohistidine phosphatase n=1 Tax=Planctomicrobium piriforme TaxID=1576369 RepID=A0A1I3QSN4_9PLAN|nr:histidine phosphatase family protein [Planctomicrobium piriforme]SFJ36107.1 phosphohistidine phosphatase [Planctomicrobium piriforme]